MAIKKQSIVKGCLPRGKYGGIHVICPILFSVIIYESKSLTMLMSDGTEEYGWIFLFLYGAFLHNRLIRLRLPLLIAVAG